ncbi:MAG: DUF512 domain-containing protein [Dehalococcoidia bacterium]|nr:MAG: DUF512 domain-containing protein [Dehalococcoidia bacterium]
MNSFQDIKNASLYEPRIQFIKKQLESLLAVVDLEKEGRIVEVDGFRLKNLKDWLVPSSCDPIEVFEYAGSHCDCDCLFCYNRGNPPSVALGNLRRPPREEFEEMRTRIDYFFPKAKSSLFSSLGEIYEVSIHPHFLEVLRLLRGKTPKVLRITTNGKTLTPDVVSRLAELKPVYLYLSLNSASPSRRRKLMRDRDPQIAIDSLPLLKEAGIPYAVLIVPWPMDSLGEMLDDLGATVSYAEEHDAHLVGVNLPGYSKYFSQEKLFDLDEVWSATVSHVRNLREKTACPIVVMPSMYEENLYEGRKNLPKVIAAVKNSPAAGAGLGMGDQILEINGISIASRPQARDLLFILQRSENREARLRVEREGRTLQLSLNLEDFSYPYSRESDNHLGIIFMGTGLRLSYLERLKEIIDSYKAKHVLFLSSILVKPTFEQCLAESHLFGDLRIDIQVLRNNFFGGNVFMGDLLVVQDFIDFIKEYLERNRVRPDLIVIPSSPFNLGQWGRDLTGRVYLEIEREVGIPVELLECASIYD